MKKIILIILTVCVLTSCSNASTEVIMDAASILQDLHPQQLKIKIDINGYHFITDNDDSKEYYLVSNISRIHFIEPDKYYIIYSIPNEQSKIAIPNMDTNEFELYSFSSSYAYSDNFGKLGWITKDQNYKNNQKHLYIYDFLEGEMSVDELFEFITFDAYTERELYFNDANISIEQKNVFTDEEIFSIRASQAGYTFLNDTYVVNGGQFYQQSSDDHIREPNELIYEEYRIKDNKITFVNGKIITSNYIDNSIVSASISENGFLTIIKKLPESSEGNNLYEVLYFNGIGQYKNKFSLANVFSISDQIISIDSISGVGDESRFVINTDQFNYDFTFNHMNSKKEIQLRFRDFNRFVK